MSFGQFSVALPIEVVASGGIPVRQVDLNGAALDDSTYVYSVALPVMPVSSSGVNENSSLVFSTWRKVTLDPNGIPVVRVDAFGAAVATPLGGTNPNRTGTLGKVLLNATVSSTALLGRLGSITKTLASATLSSSATTSTSTLLSPSVAFDTPTYLNPPNVVYTLASDAVMGDWIGREYANNASFTGSTTEWHQVTSDEIINGSITWPFSGAFADGTLYLRAYAARGTGPGSFTLTSSPSSAVSRAVYDYQPNAWDFTDQNSVAASTLISSAAVTPTGYTGPLPVVTNGNPVSIAGGAYSTSDTNISPGQSISVQATSSATAGASVTVTINVGGVDVTFQVTTAVSGADFVASTTQLGHMTSGYSGSVDFVAGRQLVAILLDNTVNTITGVTIGGAACTRLGGSTNNRWDLWELAAGTAGTKTVTVTGAGGDAVIMTGTVTGASGAGSGLTVKDFGFAVGPYTTPASLTVAANGVGVVFVATNRNSNTFTSWNNGFIQQAVKTDATQYEGRIAKKLTSGQPSISYTGTTGVAMFGIVYPG